MCLVRESGALQELTGWTCSPSAAKQAQRQLFCCKAAVQRVIRARGVSRRTAWAPARASAHEAHEAQALLHGQ